MLPEVSPEEGAAPDPEEQGEVEGADRRLPTSFAHGGSRGGRMRGPGEDRPLVVTTRATDTPCLPLRVLMSASMSVTLS